MGTESLFQLNSFLRVYNWPWTSWQATRRFGALHSFGIGTLWYKWAEWVAKASDEKAFQIMKGMFPDVRKLDITGNILVIFYALMMLQAVAIAIFAVEYLRSLSIFDLITKQTLSDVPNCDQSSQLNIESQTQLGAFIDSATDQPVSNLTVLEPAQSAAIVSDKDGDDLDVSIEGGNITPIVYIDEACAHGSNSKDGVPQPGDYLLSLGKSDFQILATKSLVVTRNPQQRDDVGNCDKATNDDSINNDGSNIAESPFGLIQVL
ncbi:unnamed protein product [Orchesella dallaii]|uniref:Uncharacterized protein n=1 Tax=Orchesella dallaii TaxID=48710 RepID=A0ABP1RTQ7_9HEXA